MEIERVDHEISGHLIQRNFAPQEITSEWNGRIITLKLVDKYQKAKVISAAIMVVSGFALFSAGLSWMGCGLAAYAMSGYILKRNFDPEVHEKRAYYGLGANALADNLGQYPEVSCSVQQNRIFINLTQENLSRKVIVAKTRGAAEQNFCLRVNGDKRAIHIFPCFPGVKKTDVMVAIDTHPIKINAEVIDCLVNDIEEPADFEFQFDFKNL